MGSLMLSHVSRASSSLLVYLTCLTVAVHLKSHVDHDFGTIRRCLQGTSQTIIHLMQSLNWPVCFAISISRGSLALFSKKMASTTNG